MEPKIRLKGFSGEWTQTTLGGLSTSISSGKDTMSKGRFPLYGSTGIIGTVNAPSHQGQLLLVARVGVNAGSLQLINEPCGVTDNTLVVCPKTDTSLDYLYHFFQHKNLNNLVYGSGQPLITGGMLKKTCVTMGNKEECECLVDYFQHLDSLIQSTTKKIDSFKQVKAASLQAMFPQEGETTPQVRFKGFEGEWEKVCFSNLYEPSTIKNTKYGANKIISVANMHFADGTRQQVGTDYLKTYNVMHLGDIAFEGHSSKEYSHGRFVENSIGDGIVSHIFIVLKPISKFYDVMFWKYYINNDNIMKNVLIKCTKASTMMNDLVVSDFLKESVLVPSFEEQKEIGAFFKNLDTQITLQTQRLEKLKQIKSACLDNMFV